MTLKSQHIQIKEHLVPSIVDHPFQVQVDNESTDRGETSLLSHDSICLIKSTKKPCFSFLHI